MSTKLDNTIKSTGPRVQEVIFCYYFIIARLTAAVLQLAGSIGGQD